MSTTNNSINNQIGSPATNNFLTQIRSTSGQWQEFDDQTDVHGYYSGVGSPEGVVAADIGSIYTDTGAGASGVYYKTTDTVNTGWVNIPSSSGPLVDYSYTNLTTPLATSTIIPLDNTIPQITEGAQYISLAYTPHSASNILIIEFSSYLAIPAVANLNVTVALFNGANDAIAAVDSTGANAVSVANNCYICAAQVAGTTSPITFSVRFGPSSANSVTMNGGGGATPLYGGVGSGYLKIYEYQPPGSAQVAGAFSVVNQTFTTPGAFTYTPTAGMQYVEVELVGGGGGGGGVATALGLTSAASGGGAGGYAKFILSAAQVGASLAGVVGAGGAGGAAGNNNGTAGSSTTLATAAPWTVAGGAGGLGSAAVAAPASNGVLGGAVTTGTGSILVTMTGGTSGNGAGSANFAYSGGGGSNSLAQGGIPIVNGNSQSLTGVSGTGYGAGGSGANGINVALNRAGGNATDGIAIFKEYVIS